MATVNRYTRTQENKYTPRTLQELMIAPAYKRQKHDELEESIAEYDTALSQFGSMYEHDNELKKEQEKLYNQMTQQRDKLDKEGFSKSSKSDFLKFNKDFQRAIGPQGSIGKIQSAKESFEKSRSQILDVAMKQQHDLGETQKRISEQKDIYIADFKETGEIKDFEGVLPPSYHDLDADIKNIKAQLGQKLVVESNSLGDYEIKIDTSSGVPAFVVITEDGHELKSDNLEALKDAEEYLRNKWVSEGGAGRKSAEWNGMDLETIMSAITSGLSMMKESRREDNTTTKVSVTPMPGDPKDKDEYTGNKLTKGLSRSSGLFELQGVKNIEEFKEKINTLANSDNLTDQAQAKRLQESLDNITYEYNSDHPKAFKDYEEAHKSSENLYNTAISDYGDTIEYNALSEGRDKWKSRELNVTLPASDFSTLKKSMINGNLMLEELMHDAEGNERYMIFNKFGGMKAKPMMQGGNAIKDLYEALEKGKEVIGAYESGLENKLAYEKTQNIKFNVTTFDTDTKQKLYNNTMRNAIQGFGENSLKPSIGYVSDGKGGASKKMKNEDVASMLEVLSNPNADYTFDGFIMQTTNGVPAISIAYNAPPGAGEKVGKTYKLEYELNDFQQDGSPIDGAAQTILRTLEQFGGDEAVLMSNKLRQSIEHKNLHPTFHEDDFSQSPTIKSGLLRPLRSDEQIEEIGYGLSDILNKNGILENDIDISSGRASDGSQFYEVKLKDTNGDVKKLKYGDLLLKDEDGMMDFNNIPEAALKYIAIEVSHFTREKKVNDLQDLTGEQIKEFEERLMNINIKFNNHYNILDLLSDYNRN